MRLKKISLDNSWVLLIALNGIGNLLLATPLLKSIRKGFPRAHISVLALGDSLGALRGSPDVDEVIPYPGKAGLAERIMFLLNLRKRHFDVSIYPYPNVNIMSALIGLLIGAKERVNFEYRLFGKYCGFLDTLSIPVDLSKHDIEKNLDILKRFGISFATTRMSIPIARKDRQKVDALLKGKAGKKDVLIGMHVGSKESMRVWPTENFAQIVTMLSLDKRIKILLVGTKIEEELILGFSQFKGENIINLINKTTIPQTTEAISRCRLFVTTDSGPMHMAVASGTKVVAIYLGPHIKRTAPYGKEHVVFLTNKATMKEDKNKNHVYVDSITPEMVHGRVMRELGMKR